MTASSPFFVRTATPRDVRECHEIDVDAWGAASAAPEAMLLKRIERYPAGNFVAIDRATGAIVGSTWSLGISGMHAVSTWEATSGKGTYDGVCDPHSDTLYGINMSVRPGYSGRGVGEHLALRCAEMAWILGKRWALMGCRIPEYHKWQAVFTAEDYIRLLRHSGSLYFVDPMTGMTHVGPKAATLFGTAARVNPRAWPMISAAPQGARTFDGELAYFTSFVVRGQPCRILRLLPGYFPDPESCDYGALISWENDQHPDAGTGF